MTVLTNRKYLPVRGFRLCRSFPVFISPGRRLKDSKLASFLKRVLVSVLLFSFPAQGQYDSLLHQPYGKKVLGIHSMYNDLIEINDSTLRAGKAEEIKRFSRKHKDRALELNVDFFLVFWNTFYQRQPKEVSLIRLTEQLELTTKENVDFLRARSLRALAEFYWKIEKNYERAFEQYLLLDKELATLKPGDYPEMARDLMQIGEAYFFFQDYPQAITYFKKAIALPENIFNTMVINAARNNLGLCYQQESKLDSSDYYFSQVLRTTFPEAQVWKRISTGNMGTNRYLLHQYDKAIPLLETDFYGAVKENDNGCAAGAAITLADIYREKGEMNTAKTFIAHARHYIEKAGQPERLRLLYPVMSKWYAMTGDKEMSKRYVDSSVIALSRYNEKFSALKVLRAQQKVERQNEELRRAAITLERERKAAERNFLLLLVLLLCIAMALTYFIQKKRQLDKDLKLQKASQELETARLSLKRFTQSVQEKNKLIEELEQQLDKNTPPDLRLQLQQTTILTEEDWHQFKSLFEQVHGGFLQRLREKYPSFSPAEIRFVSLVKLNFSTKEMATALGVSPQSIRTNWYRIRKKLDLPEIMTVNELVKTV